MRGSGREHWSWLGPIVLGCVGLACGPGATGTGAPHPPLAAVPPASAPSDPPAPSAAPPAVDDGSPSPAEPEGPLAKEIDAMLGRIAVSRQLPVKQPVVGRQLSRGEVIKLIIAKAERDIPRHALEAQGELLRAFELIALTYDFVDGIYGLVENNVAGLYDDDTDLMILLDDLDNLVAEQTLAHELVHALQDQHYDLDKVLKYQSGHSDRVTAQHALAEGDATSAMLDVTQGSAFAMSNDNLRLLMRASVALSPGGAQTPRVLQAALVAPYLDGFAFVQELRRRGGWVEVDRAWQRMPISTEQLLHIDKYDQAEPPIAVPTPPNPGPGWQKHDADVLGEQGLRMILEQWTHRKQAAAAAAGWGGDTYMVAQRATSAGTEIAVAWHLRFDNARDAREAAQVVRKRFGQRCRRRTPLGPLAWRQQGDGLAIVAGPHLRDVEGKRAAAKTSCVAANRWLAQVLKTR